MASTSGTVTIIENSSIAPPSNSLTDKSLPLTFFDSTWLYFRPPITGLIFYKFPYSDQSTVISSLKQSLSLALKHFYPFAGNLIMYSSTTPFNPEFRYVNGDTVPITIAESNSDFEYFVGNSARNVSKLFSLVPHLRDATKLHDHLLIPLLALQITTFPNKGICIGYTTQHVIGDASTIVGFLKAWALINKDGSEGALLASGALPVYDRSLIHDPKGLCKIFKTQQEKLFGLEDLQVPEFNFPTPVDMVRATFVIDQSQIESLKRTVRTKYSTLSHVSSFVVTCAYLWSCLAKSRVTCGEEISEEEKEHFVFGMDCRSRMDPPIPKTYFGNCIAPCFVTIQSIQLLGDEGVPNGANSIGKALSKILHSEKGVLKDVEIWVSKLEEIKLDRISAITGSPKFSMYDIDFGWGEPERIEFGLDMGPVSLDRCKDSEGGLQLALSLPESKMNAFKIIFADGLK